MESFYISFPVPSRRLIVFVALCLLVGLFLTSSTTTARAATNSKARITIHPDAVIANVTPYHLGTNIAMWLGDRLYDETLRARTRGSGIKYIRMPGGGGSDDFGWLSCELREDQPNAYPCFEDWEAWAARPTDFINFINAAEIQNVIFTVNVNVTPQEAAAAVAFFNATPSSTTNIGVDANGFDWQTAGHWAQLRVDHGNTAALNIKHWEIGNEDYGGDPNVGGSDCSEFGWENTWTCDGAEYVNGANGHPGYTVMRNAMRAIDSSISVGAVGFTTAEDYNGWATEVLANAGSFMDFFVVHPYMYLTPPANTFAGWTKIMAKPRQQIPVIKKAMDNAFAAYAGGRPIPLMANEFNIPHVQEYDGQAMMTRAGNAFFVTEMMGQFIENGFAGSNQWELTNGCASNGTCYDLIQVDHNWKRAPQYYAFPLWSRFGSEMLTVDNNRDPETQLSVYAGRIADDQYSLLVLNKTGTPYKARITFANSLVVTGGTADVLSAKTPMAKNVKWNGKTNPADDLSDAPPSALTKVGTVTRYTFEPYSITLLRLNVEL